MVLPASSPDDASRESSWLDSIRLELKLSIRGVLILVDNAEPERLRELVIALLPEYPELGIVTDVQSAYTVPAGSVIVLVLHASDLEWLNQQRPVFARRELKVILWCDELTTHELRTKAVDFYDWISHRHECPPGGVFLHEVYRLRAQLCARKRVIHWQGLGNLRASVAAAFPRRRIVEAMNPRFKELVETLRSAGSAWVVIDSGSDDLVELALYESGRRGRVVVGYDKTGDSEWRRVRRDFTYRELQRYQRNYRGIIKHICRIVALADFDHDAFLLAFRCRTRGISESAIEHLLSQTNEPRAVLANMLGEPMPPYVPLTDVEERNSIPSIVAHALAHAPRREYADGDTLARAGAAARRALEITEVPSWIATRERAIALQAMGRVDVSLGRFREAEDYFCQALRVLDDTVTSDLAPIRLDLADVLIRQGRYDEAEKSVQEVLTNLPAVHESAAQHRTETIADARALMDRIKAGLARSRGGSSE